MEKEKKSLQGNILANSVMFSILSVAAIALGLFFLAYGLFFSFLAMSGMMGEFALTSYLQSGLFIAASLVIFVTFARNSKWLWAQWQRKQAIDAEEARVSRLVDNSAEDDAEQAESSEMIQQNKL